MKTDARVKKKENSTLCAILASIKQLCTNGEFRQLSKINMNNEGKKQRNKKTHE